MNLDKFSKDMAKFSIDIKKAYDKRYFLFDIFF